MRVRRPGGGRKRVADLERGRPPRLAFPDQVLAAVLHLLVALAAEPLAVLFGSSRTAMHRTLLKIRTLLKAHSIVISPAVTPSSALTSLQARVQALSGGQDNALMICKPLTLWKVMVLGSTGMGSATQCHAS